MYLKITSRRIEFPKGLDFNVYALELFDEGQKSGNINDWEGAQDIDHMPWNKMLCAY
jgi:hypothetical protein